MTRQTVNHYLRDLQQAIYDILRAMEVLTNSMTTDGDPYEISPHRHGVVANSPEQRITEHLESAARMAGLHNWVFDYLRAGAPLIPELPDISALIKEESQ